MSAGPPIPSLLPCPFCGGEAKDGGIATACLHCGATGPLHGAWNTRVNRTPDPALIEKLEHLKDDDKCFGKTDVINSVISIVSQHEAESKETSLPCKVDKVLPSEIPVIGYGTEVHTDIGEKLAEFFEAIQADPECEPNLVDLQDNIFKAIRPYLRTTESVSLNNCAESLIPLSDVPTGMQVSKQQMMEHLKRVAKTVLDAAGVKYE